MIYITLYLLYALCILFIFGVLIQRFFEKFTQFTSSSASLDIANIIVIGIISLTTIISIISIFFPLNEYIHVVVLILLLLYFYYDRSYVIRAFSQVFSTIKRAPYLFSLGSICLFSAIFYVSGSVMAYDTGLYHAQAVKWINEYRAVPGLGNLHGRLAFNSSWFVLGAFFNIMTFEGKTYHLLNLIIFTLGLIVCLSGFHNLCKGNITKANMLKSFLAFPLCSERTFLVDNLPSLSPDIPMFFLLLYIIVLAVDYIEQQEIDPRLSKDKIDYTYISILCISFFLPTIKLSSIPILLLPLFLLFQTPNNLGRNFIFASLLGIVILLPFLNRNIVLSGYLLYPFPKLDLFTLDWKIPVGTVEYERQITKYWAIKPGSDWWSVADLSTLQWMKIWYTRLRPTHFIYRTAIASFAAIIFVFICFQKNRTFCRNTLGILGILLVGITFWFFSAPDFRFGLGWLWGYITLPLACVVQLVARSARKRFIAFIAGGIILSVCLVLSSFFFRGATLTALVNGEYEEVLWTIRPLPIAKTTAVEIHPGFIVHVPKGERAWDGKLPSTPYVNRQLQMRGPTLQQGFRIAK